MTYTCELLEQPAQPALVVRTRTPVEELPRVLGRAYAAILGCLAGMGLQPTGAPFVGYHNMDMKDLDLEIGFPVAGETEGRGEVRPGAIPGGRLATCLHTGPYDRLAAAYEALGAWIRAGGFEATGAAYEVYLNDPETTPPQELQTRLLFPLK